MLSVIADEARDISNKEYMPLIIRYADKHINIHEKFIAFVECGSTRGEDVPKLLFIFTAHLISLIYVLLNHAN